ncbi:class I SAM-dependent methyltransferase [Chengkuizengella axinellae]|uniref:Methyltransferase domain-containing protein n=1 Tax=Chengkuizengella axinellae TaxID=3064388 RepID=A0ABT9IVJ6_9BACL|nr:class I SAM-dependent methyltransferase [Chengkuizengella sp. 2205SS18-9]MDP5272834.1 methyltransferase domain-containing protein [Chengkuizengella sp. 2205SS18-9]
MLSSYSSLATEVYDITKPIGHSFGDIEFYLERLKGCTGSILEPAVGSGRMLIPLLEAGFLVDGIDNSPEMLTSCSDRCKERGFTPNLYEGKMQDFKLENKYEAVIVPTGSILLLENREESLQALQTFYEHLLPGGRLIIDIFLQTDFNLNQVSTSTWTTPDHNVITLESKIVEVDFLNQYTIKYLKYEKWSNGKLIETELQRFPLRWYGVEEFKGILEKIGFTNIVISSNYKYGELPKDANQSITFEAIRPN